jgi:proteasome-associated ATPase
MAPAVQTEPAKQSAAPLLPSSVPLEEQLARLATLQEQRIDLLPVATGLLREKHALEQALETVRQCQDELRDKLAALCAPARFPAIITGLGHNSERTVEVYCSGTLLEVAVHPDVPDEGLRIGARGLLTQDRNCLLHVNGDNPRYHDVGTFESYAGDDRMLLRYQEQLVLATQAEDLAGTTLRKGDLVGFDRDGARLAYARVEPPGKEDLFFEDTPMDRFEELGGLEQQIAQLQRAVSFSLCHRDKAARYRLPGRRGILLVGPPGSGKTKLARCLARYVADLAPDGACRFMAVAGSSDYSMWLGQSEQRLIARFEAARQLASAGGTPVVLFFDEIDAIGRRRGSDWGSSAPDRILATFLAQLDGVRQLTNLIVLGATNRADILDPGLTRQGRLGDIHIRIPPPNRRAGRAILHYYLGGGLPVAGEPEMLIETLLGRIYSPRGEHAELARVTLRDGRKVVVGARDFVSGALLENVVRSAAEEAAEREVLTGQSGIREEDLVVVLERELRGVASVLTPGNVRDYVARLPQEVDPVAVEPLVRGPAASFTRDAG